jgi:hypothetical protein
LLVACLLVQAFNSASADNFPRRLKNPIPDAGKIDFKGVSFSYDRQIFTEAKSEELPEQPLGAEDEKPDSVAPRHILFSLKSPGQKRDTLIYVFPVADYRRMYAVSKNYTEQFDKEITGLQKAIKDKNFQIEKQIPFVPFWDGSQTFQGKIKHFSFQNGKGIFFLTQFDIEPSLINSEGLTYCFQGITSDGKHYVLAKFSVGASFLPVDYRADKFEDYQLPMYFTADKSNEKRHRKYLSKITKRLENLSPDEFDPHLKYFDEIISSLKIEK